MFMPASRNTPGEPPKCKYCIVTVQSCNVVFAIIMFSLSGKPNRFEQNPSFNWTALISLIAILLIFVAIKLIILYKDHVNQEASSPKDRCRRDLLIGYGAISIFGYIPLIVMYIIGEHPFFVTSALICYIPPSFIFLLFILQHLKKYQVRREYHSRNYHAACFFLHVTVFMAIAFLVGHLKTGKQFVPFIIMWDTLMFTMVRGEFLSILVNEVWLKEQVRQPVMPQEPLRRISCHSDSGSSTEQDSISENSVRIDIDHKPGSKATECQICLLRYSSSIIPRILIGCGHTVCEKCARKLPRLGDRQNRVLCPFCRNSTRLPGGKPEQLPKNFTVLDIVAEQKNQRNTGELAQEEAVF